MEVNKKLYRGLLDLCESQRFYNWKELCQELDIEYIGGNRKLSVLNTLKRMCQLEKDGNKFKVVKVNEYNEIKEDIIQLCKKYRLKIIGGLEDVETQYDKISCCCNIHSSNNLIETSLYELKRGVRKTKCCCFGINVLQASIYLYVKNIFPDAVLRIEEKDKPIMEIKSIKKTIKFIGKGKDGVDGSANLYLSLSSDHTIPRIFDNIIYYTNGSSVLKIEKLIWEFFNLPKVSRPKEKDIDMPKAVVLMMKYNWQKEIKKPKKQELSKSKNTEIKKEEQSKIKEKKIKKNKPTQIKPLDKNKIYLVDFNPDDIIGEKMKKEEPPIRINRQDLAHLIFVNKNMELKGEFNSYNEVIEAIKTGNFLDYLCFID